MNRKGEREREREGGIGFAKGVIRRRWSSLKNDSHSMFPLEVKPLLVGQGLRSWQAGSSYWPDRKTTIKGDEYFMGYAGTIGRGVWAIVKPLSGRNARQASLSPFDSWLLGRREKRTVCASIILLFSNTSPSPLLSSLVFFLLLVKLGVATEKKKKKICYKYVEPSWNNQN